MALKLHLRETPAEICDRNFLIREMSSPQQERFYDTVAEIARHQAAWEEHNKNGTQESQEAREAKNSLDSANLRLWQQMLIPTDEKGQITMEWVKENTNGRFGDEVVREQMRLNDFDQQMGKAQARMAAMDQAQAALSRGPIFAAQSAPSIT